MSVYMFLLLYHINSLRGQSGRYPVYRGVQMYNSALFPFIVSVQYFLECLKGELGVQMVVV